jgi:DNA-binding NarL/FixJ family response regulator
LVADDHKILRELIVSYLKQKEAFEVVGEAADGHEALKDVIRLLPEVLILDISLPMLNGLDVAMQLKSEAPSIKVIILTMHKSEEFVRKAFEAGAACTCSGKMSRMNSFKRLKQWCRVAHTYPTISLRW